MADDLKLDFDWLGTNKRDDKKPADKPAEKASKEPELEAKLGRLEKELDALSARVAKLEQQKPKPTGLFG